MGKLLGVVLLLAAGVVGLGVCLGWFQFSTGRAKGSDKIDINLTIDEQKIKADTEKAMETAKDLGAQIKDQSEDVKAKDAGAPGLPKGHALPPKR